MNSDEHVKDIFKFDPDRVQRYKVILRRNRLFGFWVGEQLDKLDCEMLDYIATVVHADLEESGDLDILCWLLANWSVRRICVPNSRSCMSRHATKWGRCHAARISSSRHNSPVLPVSSCLCVVASMP
jgi:hypothetical protein